MFPCCYVFRAAFLHDMVGVCWGSPWFWYYFGRIPFLLKQKHPLNYTIKITRFSPDGTKRLFFGNRKQKRAIEQPFSLFIIYQLNFYRFTHIQTQKLCILSRKLPSGFRDNIGSFRVCIWVLPANMTSPFSFYAISLNVPGHG